MRLLSRANGSSAARPWKHGFESQRRDASARKQAARMLRRLSERGFAANAMAEAAK